MRTSPARGRWAEDVACRFLAGELGFREVARNVRLAGGEIDLVMRHGEVLVFVEVKARRAGASRAAEAVTAHKQRRIARAAALWLAKNGTPRGGCRFDLVTVAGRGDRVEVGHVPGAFESPVRFDM